MAQWQVTISGKGIRRDAVDQLAKSFVDRWSEKATVSVKDATPPESRADRFSAAMELVCDARCAIEELRDELQEWFDGMPENLQGGDKGSQLNESVSQLEDLIGSLEEIEGQEVEFPGMY